MGQWRGLILLDDEHGDFSQMSFSSGGTYAQVITISQLRKR